jgi:hypothetical protein
MQLITPLMLIQDEEIAVYISKALGNGWLDAVHPDG